jgi:hypothetical protein
MHLARTDFSDKIIGGLAVIASKRIRPIALRRRFSPALPFRDWQIVFSS